MAIKITENTARNRIEKLKEVINYHRYLYHAKDKQEISDEALDSCFDLTPFILLFLY